MKMFLTLVLLFLCCTVCAENDKSAELGIASCDIDVKVLADKSVFTLIVSNKADTKAVIEFPTSQQYDFIVKTSEGMDVWKWSDGQMFSQVITAFELDPKEEKKFEAECILGKGKYKVRGIVPSIPAKIETELREFEITQSQNGQKVLKGKIAKILDKTYFLGDDGVAYLVVEMPDAIKDLNNKKIEVTSFQTESITGSVDRKIIIKKYIE
jgi:hypothetical protein